MEGNAVLSLSGACLLSPSCGRKEALEMRAEWDGCSRARPTDGALTQNLPRFLGWDAERLSKA